MIWVWIWGALSHRWRIVEMRADFVRDRWLFGQIDAEEMGYHGA